MEKAESKETEDEGGKAGEMKEEGETKGEVEEKKEEEEEHEAPSGVRDPRPCEVCKYLAVELQGRLEETGKVKDYIITGHGIMPGDRKKKDYKKSELRFIEAVHEPHVCDKILDYDIHAERKRSLRYAKGPSETRRTLHALVDKGVKVELGIPQEMWERDSPPNEITHLQRLCIDLVERYEEDLEDWYWGHQDKHLLNYLCRDRALKNKDTECLKEVFIPEKEEEEKEDETDEEEKEETVEEKAAREDETETKGDPGTPSSAMPPLRSASPGTISPSSPSADNDSIRQTPLPGTTAMPRTLPPPTKTVFSAPSSQTASTKEEL